MQIQSGCSKIFAAFLSIIFLCCVLYFSFLGGDIADDPIYRDVTIKNGMWGAFQLEIDPQFHHYWEEAGWKFVDSPMPQQLNGWLCMPSTSGTWHKVLENVYVGCCFQGSANADCDNLLINNWYGNYIGEIVDSPWWVLQQSTWTTP